MAARKRAASRRTSAGRARKDGGEERYGHCGTAASEEGEAVPAREMTERSAADGAERSQRKKVRRERTTRARYPSDKKCGLGRFVYFSG